MTLFTVDRYNPKSGKLCTCSFRKYILYWFVYQTVSQGQTPERKGTMPRRLETEIKYTAVKHYLFSDPDELTRGMQPDTPEYFTWLAGLKSFHFSGKDGHFTPRRESRKNKDGTARQATYWSAYRKHNHKQLRRYLGVTSKLSITLLEDAARHLTDVCTTQPPKVKTPRKRPEKREILYARIKAREETIAHRDQTIAELEQKISSQEQEIKELKASNRRLEAALKTKRENLEL